MCLQLQISEWLRKGFKILRPIEYLYEKSEFNLECSNPVKGQALLLAKLIRINYFSIVKISYCIDDN